MESDTTHGRMQAFERAVSDGAPQGVLWDEIAGIAEELLERRCYGALERLAERLDGREEHLLAAFVRALLDLAALDFERARRGFEELTAPVGCSLLPRMHAIEAALALGMESALSELAGLLEQVLEEGATCTERELAQLGELLFRAGDEQGGLLLAGRYRRRVSGARAAAALASAFERAGRELEAAHEAARALLAWPPPAEALAVLAKLCERRGYSGQGQVLQNFAARLVATSGAETPGVLARPLAGGQRAQARAFERRFGRRFAGAGAPGSAPAPGPGEALEPSRDLPELLKAAAYYLEDHPPLAIVLRHLLRRGLRRCPAAAAIALAVGADLVQRGRPRLARGVLVAALRAGVSGADRQEVQVQLRALGEVAPAGARGEEQARGAGETAGADSGFELGAPAPIGENLASCGRALSAAGMRLRPVYGPCGPIELVLRSLAAPARRSVLMVGESGVGKTALAHEIVRRIRAGRCPERLRGFRVVELSVQDLLVGTEYVGSLQTKMSKILAEAHLDQRILLYLPDIAFAVGAGSYDKSDYDIAASLVSALEREEILVLGEARPEEVRIARSRRRDFLRWFERVELREPTAGECLQILTAAADSLAAETGVSADPEALRRLIELHARFLPGRRFPGKAYEFLEQLLREGAGASVGIEVVAAEFARRTGFPRAILLEHEPLDLEATERFFTDRVLGQNEAVEAVVDQLAMLKAGLTRPGQPLGSFFFVGPTGIGKTEMARSLAAFLFGSEERLIRLDMSEFASSDAIWRLSGTPGRRHDPGTRALLTDAVREQPFSVVLLDEIEKAAPEVFDLLLQVLDAGRLTDARGESTDFCNTILIMTSNLGARRAQEEALGFQGGVRGRSEVLKAMERHFRPEFLNRIGRVMVFRALDREDLRKLAFREVGRVLEREGVLRKHLDIEIDPELADFVLEHGFSRRYGARHLQRAVEERVAIPLARTLVRERVERDAALRIFPRGNHTGVEVISFETPAAQEARGERLRADEQRRAPGREAQLALQELAERLESLVARVDAPQVVEARQRLEEEMSAPNFWDRPASAAEVQHEYTRLVRRIDRVRRLEVRLGDLRSQVARGGGARRVRQAIEELGAVLDTAEIESLLGGPRDGLDAFVVISASSRRREAEEWVRTLVRMYRKWAQRRRMEVEMLAELPPQGPSGGGVLLRVLGTDAHGYLQAERGPHRLVHLSSDGRRRRQSHTARVEVFPDVGIGARERGELELRVERQRSRAGIVLPRLGRRLHLLDGARGLQIEMLAPSSTAGDEALRAWMAARRALAGAGGVSPGGGELVRQYRLGRQSEVRDPWTGVAVRGTTSVLGGAIQGFVLERLRRMRVELDAPDTR